MPLCDLCDDAVGHIVGALPPQDIIGFASSSKRINVLSKLRLLKHMAYQRKFRILHITNDDEAIDGIWTCDSPLRALCQILDDPERAFYVHEVKYKNVDIPTMVANNLNSADELVEFVKFDLMRYLSRCPLLSGLEAEKIFSDIQSTFSNGVTNQEHCHASGHSLILLLSLLPNIEKLELSDATPCLGLLGNLITSIKHANLDDTEGPLSKLRTLFIQSVDSIAPALRFLHIPSLRQLYVANVVEKDTGTCSQVLDKFESTNLRVIGLADTALTPRITLQLVELSPQVQSLNLAWDEDFQFPGRYTVANLDGNDLLDHAIGNQKELEKLFASRGWAKRFTRNEETLYALQTIEIAIERPVPSLGGWVQIADIPIPVDHVEEPDLWTPGLVKGW